MTLYDSVLDMDNKFDNSVFENRYGFYELKNKPSAQELKQYYAEKYYQEDRGAHEKKYTQEEIKYINNKLEQKYRVACSLINLQNYKNKKVLDVGAGEGWALKYFEDKGWLCTGIDFSSYGCENHNPSMIKNLLVGNILDLIDKLYADEEKYQIIHLDNVLEHVLEPLELLTKLKNLIVDDGVLIVDVPNDFSRLQQSLLEQGLISRQFWLAVPDHISYFNLDGLKALSADAGWDVKVSLGDFPIDFNLFNSAANYVENPVVGKSCHKMRVAIENLMHEISPDKTNELYKALADLGMGRQIIVCLQPVKV